MAAFIPNWKPDWGEIEASKKNAYELALVKYMANQLGMHETLAAIKKDNESIRLFDLLTSINFPMWLGAGKPKPVALSGLLSRPTKTGAYEGYRCTQDERPEGYEKPAVGFVFPMPEYGGKFTVLHSMPWPRVSGGPRTTLFIRDEQLILESMQDLLLALGPQETW